MIRLKDIAGLSEPVQVEGEQKGTYYIQEIAEIKSRTSDGKVVVEERYILGKRKNGRGNEIFIGPVVKPGEDPPEFCFRPYGRKLKEKISYKTISKLKTPQE